MTSPIRTSVVRRSAWRVGLAVLTLGCVVADSAGSLPWDPDGGPPNHDQLLEADTFSHSGPSGRAPTTRSSVPAPGMPTAKGSLPHLELPAGVPILVDLATAFELANVQGPLVRVNTAFGAFHLELLSESAPATVQNFLSYVADGSYTNVLVHRSVPGFVVQAGGFRATLPPVAIPQKAPVVNEFGRSNLRGTVAMAKLGGNPNSATNQWFVNLGNNSANLDNQNGGFTVFAQVIGTGMSVVDAIAGIPIYNAGPGFEELPLRNIVAGQTNVTLQNLVVIQSVKSVPVFPTSDSSVGSALSFTVENSNPSAVGTQMNGSQLTVTPIPGPGGTATIRVTASDPNGNAATQTFTATAPAVPVSLVIEHPPGSDWEIGSGIDFGPIAVPARSSEKAFAIRNPGPAPLIIDSVEVEGPDAAAFRVRAAGGTLAAGETLPFFVSVNVESPGLRTGTLVVKSNAAGGDVRVALSATGEQPNSEVLIGQPFDLPLFSSISNLGTVRGIRGLPPGLRYDRNTGKLVGRPTTAGSFAASVTVTQADGTVQVLPLPVRVEAMPTELVGTFSAFVEAPPETEPSVAGLGGWLRVTSSTQGALTGTLTLGARRFSFRGQIRGEIESQREDAPLIATMTIVVDRKNPARNVLLEVRFFPNGTSTVLSGSLESDAMARPIQPGWRHVWNANTNPAFGGVDHQKTVLLVGDPTDGPAADGSGTVRLSKSGVATWAAKLGDGRAVTGAFAVSPEGVVPWYTAIRYPGGGALAAQVVTNSSGQSVTLGQPDDPNARWIKFPTDPAKADPMYPGGFDWALKISEPMPAAASSGGPTSP